MRWRPAGEVRTGCRQRLDLDTRASWAVGPRTGVGVAIDSGLQRPNRIGSEGEGRSAKAGERPQKNMGGRCTAPLPAAAAVGWRPNGMRTGWSDCSGAARADFFLSLSAAEAGDRKPQAKPLRRFRLSQGGLFRLQKPDYRKARRRFPWRPRKDPPGNKSPRPRKSQPVLAIAVGEPPVELSGRGGWARRVREARARGGPGVSQKNGVSPGRATGSTGSSPKRYSAGPQRCSLESICSHVMVWPV